MENKRTNKEKEQEIKKETLRFIKLIQNSFISLIIVMFYIFLKIVFIFTIFFIFKRAPLQIYDFNATILILYFGIFIILNQWRLNK